LRRSPDFVADWIAALHDMVPPHLDGTANYGTYPTLGGCLAAAKAALRRHNLGLMQLVCPGEDGQPDRLVTRILHVSGQSMEDGGVPLYCVDRNNPQKLGSTITYARRYGLLAMIGVVGSEEEDDDGQAATPPDQLPKSKPPAAPPPAPVPVVADDVPFDASDERLDFEAWADTQIPVIGRQRDSARLKEWLSENKPSLARCNQENPAVYGRMVVAVNLKHKELTNAK